MNFGDGIAPAVLGGVLIGLGSALLLVVSGRVAGVSGITAGLIARPSRGDFAWRVMFVLALVVGGYVLQNVMPDRFPVDLELSLSVIGVGGLLVGFGSRLGNGCTSGHGICGIGRASPRGFAATVTFMVVAMLIVAALRWSVQ